MKLFEHRRYPKGLPDLLMYAAVVDDGVLLLQDGTLVASWSYRGPDMAAATSDEMAILSDQLGRLLRLGSDWMIQCDQIRTSAPEYPDNSQFNNSVSKLIDDERREQFLRAGAHYESEYFLSLSCQPPRTSVENASGWLFSSPEKQLKQSAAMKALDDFNAAIERFDSQFKTRFKARRLKSIRVEDDTDAGFWGVFDEQLRYVRRVITNEDYPYVLPAIPVFLNDQMGTKDFLGGMALKLGDKHIRVYAIDSFPGVTFPGCMSVLDELPFEYRWHTRAKTLDSHVAMAMISTHMKRWQAKIRGFFDQLMNRPTANPNLDALNMRDDANNVLALVSSGEVQAAHYDSAIVMMDESEQVLDDQELKLINALSKVGFTVRKETINAVEAWLGTLVGEARCNVRRSMLVTRNLADMLPISSIWSGNRTNPCPPPKFPAGSPPLLLSTSTGASVFRLNLHVGDVGHSIVLGPTGSGKSTLLAAMAAQFLRYEDAQVFVFDKRYSMWVLSQACGGTYFDIGAEDSTLSFCPLRNLDTAADRNWAAEYVELLFGLLGITINTGQRNEIYKAVVALADSPERTLSEFMTLLQDIDLRAALKAYTLRGAYGKLFDASCKGTEFSFNGFTVFEMHHLMGMGEKVVVPALLYIFREIERRLTGQPTLVIADEAWVFLDHEMFRDKMKEMLKEFRKLNASLIFATQNLTDIYHSKIRDVILEQCFTKIYLPNPEAANESSKQIYSAFGLNNREINIIRRAQQKSQYFVSSPEGRRLFSLGLGKVTLAFVAASDPAEIAHVKDLMREYPDRRWVTAYVRERCGDSWAEYHQRLRTTYDVPAMEEEEGVRV